MILFLFIIIIIKFIFCFTIHYDIVIKCLTETNEAHQQIVVLFCLQRNTVSA